MPPVPRCGKREGRMRAQGDELRSEVEDRPEARMLRFAGDVRKSDGEAVIKNALAH